MSGYTAAVAYAAMATGTILSAYSSYQQGENQKDWADYQAKQAEADANADKSAAEVHAEMIRKMARRQAGEATASLAGSGVDVGEGTALNINKEIYGNAEEDAMLTIFGGSDRAARGNAEAAGYRLKGSQAQQAGYLNATSTILGSAGSVASGWKTSRSATTTTGVSTASGTAPGYSSTDLGSGLRIG